MRGNSDRHGLDHGARAALLADAWTGSFSKQQGLDFRRTFGCVFVFVTVQYLLKKKYKWFIAHSNASH